MKRKALIIVLAIIIGMALLGTYNYFVTPETSLDEKEVEIRVKIKKEDINEAFTFTTQEKYLTDLLKEEQKKLGSGFKDSEMGNMVTEMMNYETEGNEFFHISIDDKEAESGADEIVLQDGEIYTFELREY